MWDKDNIQIINSYEEVVRNYSYYKGQGNWKWKRNKR